MQRLAKQLYEAANPSAFQLNKVVRRFCIMQVLTSGAWQDAGWKFGSNVGHPDTSNPSNCPAETTIEKGSLSYQRYECLPFLSAATCV
jgi:hypothetical protein